MTEGSSISSMLDRLPNPDQDAADAVRDRSQRVLRPTGALQRLDDLAIHMAAWQRTTTPSVDAPWILVFAGDHGVAAAGVSNYPSDITAAMLAAVSAERATINAFAASIGAELTVHDVGVGRPTGDLRTEPALDDIRAAEIESAAVAAVDHAVAAGADLVVLGELGIGNTTAAAALCAAIIGGDAEHWVGRGTGVDDDGMARKVAAVTDAQRRVAHIDDPLRLMREVGGAELYAMACACLRARRHSTPVVLDGFLAGAAVVGLFAADPASLDHCIAGHVSSEPGHRRILEHLGLQPVVDLDLRLGEGSGAAAAIPLIRLGCAGVVDVATFDEWFGA